MEIKNIYLNLFMLLMAISMWKPVRAQETQVQYLSGTDAEHTVTWDFYCSAGRNSGKWTKIAVPSCWEQQGFGSYNYGHDPLKERLNETGTYRHSFTVPADWKGKEVQVVFEGVMTDAEVHVNGVLAGEAHQGAFYEFRYDISKLLNYQGKNEIQVFVRKHSENASVNEAERTADFWMFGGIFRPVYLEAKPKVNIGRVAVNAKADGHINATVYLAGVLPGASVQLALHALGKRSDDANPAAVFFGEVTDSQVQIQGDVSDVLTWTPEAPNRYTAKFSLLDKDGQVLHQMDEVIGFRTVEVRESDGVYVNGIRVKLKGVNRHTFHPDYGRTSSRFLSIRDVNTIKDMNMNAVRMSHYPPEKHFLEVCDSLGLFVLNELTGWQKPSYDDTVGRKLLKEMILRDVNHPSIILWDNGNEGGGNYSLDSEFARWDIQHREVLHPWQQFDKINAAHYINYDYLAHDNHSRRKIFLPTEFIHGLYDGGAGAGLEDYWQKMWNDPLCAGGFIWVFADEAVSRKDRKDSLDTDGNHAPDGIVGPYHEKEGSYFSIKEIWSPVFFEKKYITPDFDGMFNIENRYTYTNLEECRFTANWVKYPLPGQDPTISRTPGKVITADLAPGQKGVLQVPLAEKWTDYDALDIEAYDPFGRIINTWSWPIRSPKQVAKEKVPVSLCNRISLVETNDQYRVTTCSLRIAFDKHTGVLKNVEREGVEIPLSNGPFIIGRKTSVKDVLKKATQDTVRITVMFENDSRVDWTITRNEQVFLEVTYKPENNNLFSGVSFDFPDSLVSGIRWLGDGPYRVYKNRMKGARFGLWEKKYNNTITGESGYVYPEFKGYHGNTYWAEVQCKQGSGFKVYCFSPDIFMRMLTPTPPQQPAQTAMEYPPGDISFLNSINSIGTKFKAPQGPQAALTQFYPIKIYEAAVRMKLLFDFL